MAVDNKKLKKEVRTFFYEVELFGKWLETLGYSKKTIYSMPLQLREFLEWTEKNDREINKKTALDFMEYFKVRKNKRRNGGLSIAHINKQIDSLNKYFIYLKKTGKINSTIIIKRERKKEIRQRIILTKQEIKTLYETTENNTLGIRDRVMLSIYYGCGLRRNEGLELHLDDILCERKLIYVRPSKNGKDRYVPLNKKCLDDIEDYILNARKNLLDGNKSEYLFISGKGKRISGEAMGFRIRKLIEKSTINKNIGLHNLRHSIATHLLEAGMDIDNIALFLGHRDLDSTQIYTHVL